MVGSHRDRPRSIRARLGRTLGFLALTLAAIAVLTVFFASASLRDGQARLLEINRVASLVDGHLDDAIAGERVAVGQIVERASYAATQAFEDSEDRVLETLVHLNDIGDPELTRLVQGVHAAHDAWADEWLVGVQQRLNAGFAVDKRVIAQGERLYAVLEGALRPLDDYVAARQEANVRHSEETGNVGVLMVVSLLGVVVVGLGIIALTLLRSVSRPLERLIADVHAAQATGVASFDVTRNDELGELAMTLAQLHESLASRFETARREAARADLFSRLGERLSTTADEADLIEAGAAVTQRLLPYASGSISLINPSGNKLTVAAAWGDDTHAVGERLDGDPRECPAIKRSVAHIVRDEDDPLVRRCRLVPQATGHQGCLPMLALGKVVGVLHLSCPAGSILEADGPMIAQRVTEQLGLALANTRLTQTLERLAMTDPLTGLGNARHFDLTFAAMLRDAHANGRNVGILFLDLDHFKTFNDSYGHPAGDEALRSLAATLTSSVRESDVVARYGGEEFVIAVADADLEAAAALAEKLRFGIAQIVVALAPGRFARLTASIGVAATDMHGFDGPALVRIADAALYEAKTRGRDRVVVAGQLPVSAGQPVLPVRPERRRARRLVGAPPKRPARATRPTDVELEPVH